MRRQITGSEVFNNVGGDASRLDGFLQFLAGAENDFLACLDLHRFPGLRIATHPRFAPLHLKNTAPDDADFVALPDVLGESSNGVGKDGFGLGLGKFMSFGNFGCDML